MFYARISSKLHINGGRGSCSSRPLFFKSLLDHHYSTTAVAAAQSQKDNTTTTTTSSFLEEYLINSLGFTKQEAISASSKLIRLNPIKKGFNLVVNFLSHLGLTRSHIKKVVCFQEPRVTIFQVKYHRILIRGLDNHLVPRIEYLRKLLGTDEKVVLALKKFALVPGNSSVEIMEENVVLLRKNGFSNDDIAKFVLKYPLKFFLTRSEKLQDMLRIVEHDWGIPRDATMFSYGVEVLSSQKKSRIDMKFEILRSYGWSDLEILRMVRILPPILNVSDVKMRIVLDYFMKEVGWSPDYLASHPVLFTLSLEGRVKPRNEILKILNEKKLNKRKAGLYRALCMRESQFQNNYLLPYKDILPGMYKSYLK